ncbi:DUF2480 family protein [Marnyiella aurantia]|uniref:DUF2480 family protein n=1 Tax=Marnyiella aurantia TaxID=2758037 RepID=A0A7D7LRS8_9FLAO|nr:DUF2480 family protein [Marnyiella aurantia]MBA5247711.1 DUF2480 family protein [Marnyiella aurantia]QMS97295.1 DUF2480 family protein [Marnyiella aurantia]
MAEDFQIKNKVADSGLINFDIASLVPKGQRIGVDLSSFLFEGIILKEKDFRDKVAALDPEQFRDAYVYIYNSAEAIVPLWAYFLITARITEAARKVVYGSREDLEVLLMHNAIQTYDFSELMHKRVLVKGCSEVQIPENAYIELVEQLKPLVKSLMFGEACSNVPIFKN